MKKSALLAVLLLMLAILLPGRSMAEETKLRDSVLNLSYTPIKMELPKCSQKIAVVKFTESKPIKDVGRSSTFRFIPSVDVGTWMAQSVFSQLKSQGFDVQYFETMDEAGDMFIITGIANKVYINRPGQLEMKFKVQFDGMVTKNNKLLFAKNYTSKQEKEMANTGDNAGKLMAGMHDTLDIFLPAAISAVNNAE
ncbi:hypothetical protein [Maridesulfovibrio sp.]|uniref:hypothetical protein n=1 Tax=Maridesulfovibrio sp. TaxID=2795000 RepID=UPI002A18D085|nr:hypothetical protein [Maridesulfovibrio sp.]